MQSSGFEEPGLAIVHDDATCDTQNRGKRESIPSQNSLVFASASTADTSSRSIGATSANAPKATSTFNRSSSFVLERAHTSAVLPTDTSTDPMTSRLFDICSSHKSARALHAIHLPAPPPGGMSSGRNSFHSSHRSHSPLLPPQPLPPPEEPSPPQAVPVAKRKWWPRLRLARRIIDSSWAQAQHYPFYVMRVQDFLNLYSSGRRCLDPHQWLRARGLVVEWDQTVHGGATLFCSHEWAGFEHPDANRVQTIVLATVLKRLQQGDMRIVRHEWDDALFFGSKRAEKKGGSRLPLNCWIWLDYISVPQAGFDPDTGEPLSEPSTSGSDSQLSTTSAVSSGDNDDSHHDAKNDSHHDAKNDSHHDAKNDSQHDAKNDSHHDAKNDSQHDAKGGTHCDTHHDTQAPAVFAVATENARGSANGIVSTTEAVTCARSCLPRPPSPSPSPPPPSSPLPSLSPSRPPPPLPSSLPPSTSAHHSRTAAPKRATISPLGSCPAAALNTSNESRCSTEAKAPPARSARTSRSDGQPMRSGDLRHAHAHAHGEVAARTAADARNARQLHDAVRSLGNYVERCAYFVVLCPSCRHAQRHESEPGAELSFASWRRRGWCRLELAAAALNPKLNQECILIRSPTAVPAAISAADAAALQPCLGAFTLERDRRSAYYTLRACVDVKVESLFNAADQHSVAKARYLLATAEHTFLAWPDSAGEPPHCSRPPTRTMGAAELRTLLRWREGRHGDDDDARVTGMTLLRYAVLARAKPALAQLLPQQQPVPAWPLRARVRAACARAFCASAPRCDLNAPLRISTHDLPFLRGMRPAHHAAQLGDAEALKMLLAAGASLTKRSDCGFTLQHMLGLSTGTDVADAMDVLPPTTDWSVSDTFLGSRPLGLAARATDARSVHKLVALGAKLDGRTFFGANLLHEAMWSEDASPTMLRELLLLLHERGLLSSSLNAKLRAPTFHWRLAVRIALVAYKLRVHTPRAVLLAQTAGATPLHVAAMRGDAECMRLLIAFGADPSVRNTLSMDVRAYSRECGPFEAIERVLDDTGGVDENGERRSASAVARNARLSHHRIRLSQRTHARLNKLLRVSRRGSSALDVDFGIQRADGPKREDVHGTKSPASSFLRMRRLSMPTRTRAAAA